jgi:UDP-N-acetylglucosamine transferase subunit ALG13
MKRLLVTTGTYGFPVLVESVVDRLRELSEVYSKITIQTGTFSLDTARLGSLGRARTEGTYSVGRASVTVKSLFPDFKAILDGHDVVVTHGGTGSLIEALKTGKALVAVPNESLKGNHQKEFLDRYRKCISVSSTEHVVELLLTGNIPICHVECRGRALWKEICGKIKITS